MQAVNSNGWFAELLVDHEPPCVSIYFPAQRAAPPADANRVHFRDNMDKAQQLLRDKYPDKRGKAALQRLHSISPEQIGPGPHDGIAVFASADFVQVIDLQRSVDDIVIVGESFHVKPLIRTIQQDDRFEILCFSPNRVRMLEGSRFSVNELPQRSVPRSIFEAHAIPVVGHRSGEPATHIRLDHFMRLVDQAVWENHSRTSHLPLIVAADEKNLAAFLAATKNQCVLDQGIAHNPDHLTDERLRDEAWKIIEPRHCEQLNRLSDEFRAAKAHDQGSDELAQVAEAAAVGRIGTLLVDLNKHIPGVLHRASGTIEETQFDPRAEDVLDDLAEMVIKMDGQVYVLPHEQMPTEAGLAAVYRY